MISSLKDIALPEPPPELIAELGFCVAATSGMTESMLDRRSLRQTLHRRMEATRHENPETYLAFYRASEPEQIVFLDGILNNETSFFRDATVFTELANWARKWFAENPRPMRILSAPCSSGEEPFSIAVTLEQAGIALDRFTILALDLSSAAIGIAQAGVYGGLSLRNISNPKETTFLTAVPHRSPRVWQVADRIRNTVRFRQANLLDPELLAPGSYDLICSRNLLIYQNPTARRQVADTLAAALAPKGRIILGAADWGRDLDALFQLETPINSFALRLRDTPLPVPVATPAVFTESKASRKIASVTAIPKPSKSDELADISALYRQALVAYLRPDESTAERLCRKILYLESDHLPSLELLAKMRRPQAGTRAQFALSQRLKRHRDRENA
jgi:chemotaxis protein methyltransferase WspC